MTSARQIAANRRNAQLSTGPKSRNGKERSRRNALHHGLTAETVIGVLEDPRHYKAFEAAVVEDYTPRSAVEREQTFRLASLLWRLRRADAIETGLFDIQAQILRERARLQDSAARSSSRQTAIVHGLLAAAQCASVQKTTTTTNGVATEGRAGIDVTSVLRNESAPTEVAKCFLRLANLSNSAFERIGRYEIALWKQVVRTILLLENIRA
jgi:hypothetical protein